MNETPVRTDQRRRDIGGRPPRRRSRLFAAVEAVRAHPLTRILVDAALLAPATLLQIAGYHYRVIGLLLIVFWCSRAYRLASSRWEIATNGLLLALSAWTILVYQTQPRGTGSAAELWGLLVHLAILRGAADWPWHRGWNWLLGSALTSGGIMLAILALFGTDWKAAFAGTSTAWKAGARSFLPGTLTNRILSLPHLMHNVSTSHGVSRGFPSNEVAGVLTLFCFLPVAWLLFHRLRWWGLWVVPVSALFIFVQLMAGSRSALLGIGAGLLYLAARRWPPFRLVAAIMLGCAVVAILVVIFVPGPHTAVAHLTGDYAGRPDLWGHGVRHLIKSPLTGSGLNRFPELYLSDHPGYANGDASYLPPHAHNLFLQTAIDLGMPGLSLFTGLVLLAVYGMFVGWSSPTDRGTWLLAAVSTGFTAFLVFNLTDAVAPGAKAGASFWLFLGLLTGAAGNAYRLNASQRIGTSRTASVTKGN